MMKTYDQDHHCYNPYCSMHTTVPPLPRHAHAMEVQKVLIKLEQEKAELKTKLESAMTKEVCQ